MAIGDIRKNQFKTLKDAASSYDVPRTTLQDRISSMASQAHRPANCQKLSNNEASVLSAWILDMDRRVLPLQLLVVHHLAQLLLSARIPSVTATAPEISVCLIYQAPNGPARSQSSKRQP